jgi:hypothetical protein
MRNKARPFKRMLERLGKRDDMNLSGNNFQQCRDEATDQEDDRQADTAAVYRSVRLFCYALDKCS